MTPAGGSGNRSSGAPPARDAHEPEDDAKGQDDGELAAMRAVWLAMRDEEPSGRGMAELLAAARAKAETMAPAPRWWQRLAAALRRPPVLALATVLVLIGGGVLLGRRLGEDKAVVPASPPIAAPRPATDSPRAAESTAEALGHGARATTAASGERPVGTEEDGAVRPASGDGGAAAGRVVSRGALTGGAVRESAGAEDAAGNVRASAGDAGANAGLDSGAGAAVRDGARPAHAAPERAAPPPDRKVATRPGPAGEARRTPLVQQCEAAARRGDCAEVRRLVERISQTDPGYRARVTQEAAFARCLE